MTTNEGFFFSNRRLGFDYDVKLRCYGVALL